MNDNHGQNGKGAILTFATNYISRMNAQIHGVPDAADHLHLHCRGTMYTGEGARLRPRSSTADHPARRGGKKEGEPPAFCALSPGCTETAAGRCAVAVAARIAREP